MLDECKGERLEEVLAIFSTAVLKTITRERGSNGDRPIAEQLALENFSYTGERTPLNTLILAHRTSLRGTLARKSQSKARYDDFAELLNLKERQAIRRNEQLTVSLEERSTQSVTDEQAQSLRDTVDRNWSGNSEWLDTIFKDGPSSSSHGLFDHSFDEVWKHVENGTIGELEFPENESLIEQLDARLRQQRSRLERWRDFEKRLSGGASRPPNDRRVSLEKPKARGFDLGFGAHEKLHMDFGLSVATGSKARQPLEEYTQLIADLHRELRNVGKQDPEAVKPNNETEHSVETSTVEESSPHTATAESMDMSPEFPMSQAGSASPSPTLVHEYYKEEAQHESFGDLENSGEEAEHERHDHHEQHGAFEEDDDGAPIQAPESPSPAPHAMPTHSTASPPPPRRTISAVSDLPPPSPPSNPTSPQASDILASMLRQSPSPAKPTVSKPRHVMSLAERTRMSMARLSLVPTDLELERFDERQSRDLEAEDEDEDLVPDLSPLPPTRMRISPTRTSPHPCPSTEPQSALESSLSARTRQSLLAPNLDPALVKLERRKSMKAEARRKRESFRPQAAQPLFEEDSLADGIDTMKLEEVDYEAVFKSRPKIKVSPDTSPVRGNGSPTKAWEGMGGVAEEEEWI
jgi:hypothetical protein